MSRGRRIVVLATVVVVVVSLPSDAHAYVGPGGVITAIGAMLALLVALVAAIAGFLWYPLKRLLKWVRRLRGKSDVQMPGTSPDTFSR